MSQLAAAIQNATPTPPVLGSGADVPYPLTTQDIRAMDAASIAMDGEPDALALMNSLMCWPMEVGVPVMDERWMKKVAAACEIAVAFCKLANNLKHQNNALDRP